MIEWVGKIWYSDSIISNEMILNSFKYAGISNELGGSQDHQFRGYENIEKGYKAKELKNEETLYHEDDYVASCGPDQ